MREPHFLFVRVSKEKYKEIETELKLTLLKSTAAMLDE